VRRPAPFQIVGLLRRFIAWSPDGFARNEAAQSLQHAFGGEGARLIVLGPRYILTTPLCKPPKITVDEHGRELEAEIETENSRYTVRCLHDGT
jgi:hypothetical protein